MSESDGPAQHGIQSTGQWKVCIAPKLLTNIAISRVIDPTTIRS